MLVTLAQCTPDSVVSCNLYVPAVGRHDLRPAADPVFAGARMLIYSSLIHHKR